jgi:WD40 repeat protein
MRIHLTKDGSAIVIFTSLSLGPAVEIYPLHRDSEGRYPPQPGQLLRLTLPRNELAMALCASADGNRIAAVTNQSLVIISPPADLTQSHTQKVFPLSSPPSDVALTDCGTTTAIASAGRITLLNTDGQTSWSISLSGRLRGINLAFSNDGSQLAVPVGEDLFLIDVLSARVRRSLVSSTGGRFTAASFSPLGGLLATVNFEGRLALWDAQTGEELLSRNLESGSLYQVRFTPDGRQLRWWGEGRAATFDLHFGENRLALNLADRLPSALPTIVSQAGTTKTNQLLETLRPLAPDMISQLLTQLPSPQTSRE